MGALEGGSTGKKEECSPQGSSVVGAWQGMYESAHPWKGSGSDWEKGAFSSGSYFVHVNLAVLKVEILIVALFC